MPRVCVLMAQGFEEIEAVTVIDVLRRGEIDVTTLSVGGTGPGSLEVMGSHGIPLRADRTLAQGVSEAWDMVILPGGIPGSTNLRDSPEVQAMLRSMAERGRKIGAICAAPIALEAAGLLRGKKATSHPGVEKQFRDVTYSTDAVVRDGNILTSRGVGTALDFALDIVRDLRSPEVEQKLRVGMLVPA
jgi:4-methyl-5(b-hydroxyethyl)-thiazole monophosphate biosynthesis